MITLSLIILIWGVISTYRIYKECKTKNKSFNPFEKSLIDYMGFIIALSILIIWVLMLSVLLLP